MPVVTFGQLPEEESGFLDYVLKTGDIWARAVYDDPVSPKYEPQPIIEFLNRFANEIVRYNAVDIYFGFREDVLHPEISIHEDIEGGTQVPFIQYGKVVEGVFSTVGGTKVIRKSVDPRNSRLIRYIQGQYLGEDELGESNLNYYSSSFKGEICIPHQPSFTKWGKKVLDWMRRHTPESVPVHRCNYETRATRKLAEACKKGLKLTV